MIRPGCANCDWWLKDSDGWGRCVKATMADSTVFVAPGSMFHAAHVCGAWELEESRAARVPAGLKLVARLEAVHMKGQNA